MHGMRSRSSGAARRRAAALGAALCAVFASASARADVVGYPPEDCPLGSVGAASHCGEYCSPLRCTSDDDCDGDMTCEPLELCLEELDCMSGGGPFTATAVRDTCEDGAACVAGTCESARVCVSPVSVQRYGCTCAAADDGAAAGAAIVGLIAAAAAFGLRRRRNGTTTRERGGA